MAPVFVRSPILSRKENWTGLQDAIQGRQASSPGFFLGTVTSYGVILNKTHEKS